MNPESAVQQWPEGISAAELNLLARITCDAWRELGFWYECDTAASRWHLRADRTGVRQLAEAIRRFLRKPEDADPGAHLHLGPYCNLRIGYGSNPRVSWRGIEGSRRELEQLISELETLAAANEPGAHEIAGHLPGEEGFCVVLALEPDGFDPASPDPLFALANEEPH